VIKAKGHPNLVARLADSSLAFVPGEEGRETAEQVMTLDSRMKARRFIVVRERKESTKTAQLSFPAGDEYEYFIFVTNQDRPPEEVVAFYDQ
jgi:hypothetical protein